MNTLRRALVSVILLALSGSFAATLAAQQVNPDAYKAMQWRLIGPYRAGRVSAVAGVPTDPSTYYIGTPGGGVWKTTSGGNVWHPIFDSVKVSSIGAVAVSPSDPNIVYVGTGEQTQGNGMYKSIDAGKTWTHIGLEQSHVISSVLIDNKNPDVVFVGVMGNNGSRTERGVYKTTDGGKTWQKVLYKDEKSGVIDLSWSPDSPKVLYAVLFVPPQGNWRDKSKEQDAAIYRSADSGKTWSPVAGKGLPTEPMGRTGIVVAPGSHSKTVYLVAAQGFFRSDDSGATWHQTTKDPRIVGNGYFSRVFVDPKNPDLLYLAQTSLYRSTDGGKNWEAWQGAPSGDDFHLVWINPADPRNMMLGVDQGAIISMDSGKTWTSWYNQPTGQFYHVSTDHHFPYYVYAAQQDSGTAAISSRSDFGEITERDWAPTGGMEFAFIEVDPLDANLVYTAGWYGSVMRFDKTTGQITPVFVQTQKYRSYIMPPINFSPQDPHTMYVAAQYVLMTTDGGNNWAEISPDLTEKPAAANAEEKDGKSKPNTATIITLAPSAVQSGVIWAGTSNGLVHVTRDAATWKNVTPAGLPDHSRIEAIEASRHDAAEAYAVVIVRQDLHPYIYRTRDYGQSWTPLVTGMPESSIARIVREDTERKGLLYAGTEDAAYVSFDDGDHWQSLQLNLPTTPVRDLAIHGDDLVVATYGRSIWILDDITPLRQLMDEKVAHSPVVLLRPENAMRARWDVNQDTPLPVEVPAGKNPPDGAIIDYFLQSAPAGSIKLAIYDASNQLVREYTDTAAPQKFAPANVPEYWFTTPAVLSKNAGLNRFVWDLRYPSPKTLTYSYFGNRTDYIEYTFPDHAIPGDTPREQPGGMLAAPGQYTLALTVNGTTYKQPLTVTLDPRVHASQQDLAAQLDAEKSIAAQMALTYDGYNNALALRDAIAERQKANPAVADLLKPIAAELDKVADGDTPDLGLGPINRELARVFEMIGSGDARPAAGLMSGLELTCQQLQKQMTQWKDLNARLADVNAQLKSKNATELPVAVNMSGTSACKPAL